MEEVGEDGMSSDKMMHRKSPQRDRGTEGSWNKKCKCIKSLGNIRPTIR